MSTTLTVRILGAGVSGLASAILLASDGHRVELIDEQFAIPRVGTSLALFGPAQAVLARLGLLETVRRLSAAPEHGTVRSADGQVLATIPAGDALLISRSDLVRILHDTLPDSVLRTRRRIEDVRPLRAGADLLVGADGVHSLVRRSGWAGRVDGSGRVGRVDRAGRSRRAGRSSRAGRAGRAGPHSRAEARAHGVTVLRGTADLAPPEISETWGRGWLFGITPLAGNGTNWFACVPEHRTGSRDQDLAHLREVVGGHRDAIDAVLAAATPERTLVHGIHTAPPVWPARQDVVLVGDAAHGMAPNLGHGANTALQDAESLALAVRLESRRGAAAPSAVVRRALRRHAARRAMPSQGWRLASEAMLHLAMSPRTAALRDRALSASVGRLGPRGVSPPDI